MATAAGITFTNRGDNKGVYAPVFLAVGSQAVVADSIAFFALVSALVFAPRSFATPKPIARVLGR